MSYVLLIKAYQKIKNIRDAFPAFIAQYSGDNKWQKLFKDSAEILHNSRWSGQGLFTLDKFKLVHHNLYVIMN